MSHVKQVTKRQRPELPTVTVTSHVSKDKGHEVTKDISSLKEITFHGARFSVERTLISVLAISHYRQTRERIQKKMKMNKLGSRN